MSYSNYFPNTNIQYKLHAGWDELVTSIKNKRGFRNIYPYVFSDKMVFVIVHKSSRFFYAAYKKMKGKNDNFSSFIFFHTIGDLKRHPDQYEIYATEFWYGDGEEKITDQMLKEKVEKLKSELAESRFGYTIECDFSTFAHDDYPPRIQNY